MRILEAVKSKSGQFVVVGSAFAAPSAFADNTAAITEAITNGQSIVALTTGGIIGVAALCFGVGLVASMLIKR